MSLKRHLCVQTVVAYSTSYLVWRQVLLDLGVTMYGGKNHNPWTILYSVHRVDCSLRVPSDGIPSVSRSS